MAEPEFVRECTGYAIGGVPPVGHPMDMTIYIDENLMEFKEIWAAAGSPHAVFRLFARGTEKDDRGNRGLGQKGLKSGRSVSSSLNPGAGGSGSSNRRRGPEKRLTGL